MTGTLFAKFLIYLPRKIKSVKVKILFKGFTIMMSVAEKEWRAYAKTTLKREMGSALVKPTELAARLKMSPDNLVKKIRRGAFSAGFFLEALEALGVEEINIKYIKKRESPRKF